MSKIGKLFQLINKTALSRFGEVLAGTGIPVVGFFAACQTEPDLIKLTWFIPAILLGAWHVVAFNDMCFEKNKTTVSANKKLSVFTPLIFLIPFALVSPAFWLVLLLVILNWDFYALSGKRYCLTGMMHNFAGGALHFLLGAAAVSGFQGVADLRFEALFMALAMTSGAMHHDALDVKEDAEYGYSTGAVILKAERWWKFAIIPLILAQGLLILTPLDFSISFVTASVLYFIGYSITVRKSNLLEQYVFRTYCRLAFAFGAVIFLSLRIKGLIF